jgi:choline dehydrogenase
MNSGIGPAEHLKEMGVPLLRDRAGVGHNLQDRYEIPVIDQLRQEFVLLKPYTFKADAEDPGYLEWKEYKRGFYTTNGGTIAIMLRSGKTPGRNENCDLLIFGIPIQFKGIKTHAWGHHASCTSKRLPVLFPDRAPAS